MALAALTSIIWGFAFVVIKLGLESFSAPQLTAVRFLVAAPPVLLVPPPRISWGSLVLIGLTLFTGQFLLLFFAYAAGLPPGLASVIQQMQVFFTVLLAAVFLGDTPTRRQTRNTGQKGTAHSGTRRCKKTIPPSTPPGPRPVTRPRGGRRIVRPPHRPPETPGAAGAPRRV